MFETVQVVRRCSCAGEPGEHPSPMLPPPSAVPTLLVAVQVHNLFQADGHGIVPVDAGRGGMVRSTGCWLLGKGSGGQKTTPMGSCTLLARNHLSPTSVFQASQNLPPLLLVPAPHFSREHSFLPPVHVTEADPTQPLCHDSRNGHLMLAWLLSIFHRSSHSDWLRDGPKPKQNQGGSIVGFMLE